MADAPAQAESWANMKISLDTVVKAKNRVPAPPSPDDNWADKMNALHRAVEGAQEYVRSRIEAEEQGL